MTAPRTSRSKASRRRKRRVKTKSLVLLAVLAAVLLLVGRGTAQIMARVSCTSQPLLINVTVSNDIAPAIQLIATVFNRRQVQVDGRCVAVQIDASSPAVAAAQIDGQHPIAGQPPPDAWIPDSSLWVDQARGFAIGAQTVNPAGFSVAYSPLMIVMPKSAAEHTAAFGKTGWRLLLPRLAGGPVVPRNLSVYLPDPTQSATGLATLIEMGRMLGTGAGARARFAKFAYHANVTSYFDDPTSLTSFVSLAAPPVDDYPVTITSEQAVIAYDDANPRQPLAASYPTGQSPGLGSPELDYPYVLTTSNSRYSAATFQLRSAAALAFGQMLVHNSYATSVLRFDGFRTAGDVPDRFPASYGMDNQLLQVAPPASASEAPASLQTWNKLAIGSRDLALIDISSAMSKPASQAGMSLELELTKTASIGLSFFPDTANIGLWEFAANLHGTLPYRRLVPIGPLPESIGVLTRREQLQRISAGLQPTGGSQVALYGSILDAYQYMQRTYQPKFFNSVLVLTAGMENAPGDITAQDLIKRITTKPGSSRQVAVDIIVFGISPDFSELQQIAHVTGGQAYQITNPQQIVTVFFQAVASRLCGPGSCAGP